jgi:hypothetical protein
MTPKEKAFELAHKFRLLEIRTSENSHMMISMADAKQCALIAVDELIKYHDDLMDVVRYELPSNIVAVIPYKYWEEVKQEIEKL